VTTFNRLVDGNCRLISAGSLQFGGAGFYIFESASAKDDSWIGCELHYVSLGYDCAAFVGSLTAAGDCIGGFVLPFGPWTLNHKGIAKSLNEGDEGIELDLADLLALFPMEPRQIDPLHAVEGIVICPYDDLEVALESDEAVTFEVSGELTILVYSDDDAWINGPVVIVRSDLLS